MKVRDSALEHGIEPTDSIQAAEHPVSVRDLGDDPHRQLRLRFDTHGRILEVVVLTGDGGDQMLIHTMKARQHYLALLD